MKVRPLLYLTAIVSAILGATVVYLVLSVPNDLRADALMKTAREEITNGNHAKARESLARVVQQYPRTDAAAAATVALSSLEKKERDDLARAIAELRAQNAEQSKAIADLQQNVTTIKATPPPQQPQPVTVVAPEPKPAAAKVAPKKKTTPKKKTSTRRRRR